MNDNDLLPRWKRRRRWYLRDTNVTTFLVHEYPIKRRRLRVLAHQWNEVVWRVFGY